VRLLVRPLALALLVGTALLGAGAVLHPMLHGDAAAQLQRIASTTYWRPLHLAMLAGSALVIVGLWVRGVIHQAHDDVPPLVCALVLLSIGFTLNALNIAYMAGAGTHMARRFAAGSAEMAPLFDATHPIGLMFARFGNLLVAIGALLLGWVERRTSGARWAALLAWAAALCGFVGVGFFDESSPAALAAVATLAGWQLHTVVRALRQPTRPEAA